MTSNYEWNKRMVEERLAARYRDADEHRLAQQAAGRKRREGWRVRLRRWLGWRDTAPSHGADRSADLSQRRAGHESSG